MSPINLRRCYPVLSCNLSRFDDHVRLKDHFHWLVAQIVATQVAGQMLHCAMLKRFAATVAEIKWNSILLSATVSVTDLATFLAFARNMTLRNDTYNLFRNGVAKQVARKLYSVTATKTSLQNVTLHNSLVFRGYFISFTSYNVHELSKIEFIRALSE